MSPAPDSNNPYASPRSSGEIPPVIPPAGVQGGPQFAPCPRCGCTYANKAGFTWWGGLLGPAILSHVNCKQCGKGYNGKSGHSNDTAIAIYIGVSVLVGLTVFGFMVIAQL